MKEALSIDAKPLSFHDMLVATMTRPTITLIGATVIATLMVSCGSLHKVSGKYEQENNPSETIVLTDDGTCLRDKDACTYFMKGNDITISMQMGGMVYNGTIDGKRLTLNQPNPTGGNQTIVFVRK